MRSTEAFFVGTYSYIGETDDQTSTGTYVSQFKDASGTHNVNWVAVFANNCSAGCPQIEEGPNVWVK